jgi:DNA-binding response OmpR family regulator
MSKILVIDNDTGVCLTIKVLFNKSRSKVISAPTGKEGLALFQLEMPDFVILETWLEDMPGFEVLQRIKATAPLCRVIVLTACPCADDKRRAFEFGADYYISKPFCIKTITNIIRKEESHVANSEENR